MNTLSLTWDQIIVALIALAGLLVTSLGYLAKRGDRQADNFRRQTESFVSKAEFIVWQKVWDGHAEADETHFEAITGRLKELHESVHELRNLLMKFSLDGSRRERPQSGD